MGGLFGKPSHSVTPEVYTGISVSTSLYGAVIPYVAGRQRVSFNLLWYGNFTAKANSSGSGGKGGGGSGGVSSYTYNTSFVAGLCLGPIQGVFQIWHDKKIETLASENLSLSLGESGPATWPMLSNYKPPSCSFTGYISGLVLQVTSISGAGQLTQGQAITGAGVAAGTVITSDNAAGGGVGGYTINLPQTVGSVGSPVAMSASAGAVGSQAVPYDHIATVASPSYNLGSSANMPNLSFEVEGIVGGWNDAVGIYDADPPAVIVDYLLNPVTGALMGPLGAALNIGSSDAPLTGVNSYQAYCHAMGLLTSPYEDTQRGATDFLQELMQCTNSEVVLSYGTLKVIPYADQAVSGTDAAGVLWTYGPALTPVFIFTDSDFCPPEGEPPVKLNRKPLADTHNIVNVEYKDRLNHYNPAPASASDLADVVQFGPRTMSTVTLHQITNPTTAKTVAQLILQANLYERNTYEFRVRADYSLLEPMDYIAINDTTLGLVNQVVRITEVEDDASDLITIKAMLVPGVVRSTPIYAWQAAQGIFVNYNALPGSVLPPVIFRMPPLPTIQATQGIALGIAVCGPSTSGTWGGCYVWCSVDGGSTYGLVGVVSAPAKYGTLAANLPAVADPDTASTLTVILNNSQLQLSTVTPADADNNLTLAIVGTGATVEVISYGNVALVTAGEYNLTYLRRGLYGTSPQANITGAQFVKLDGGIFVLAVDAGMGGQTLFFKFASFNTFAQAIESLANVPAYTYTAPLSTTPTTTFVPRGSCIVAGTTIYKASTAASAWDSDCVSLRPYDNGCQVTAKLGYAKAGSVIGLVRSTAATLTNSNINYSIAVGNGVYTIYEFGTIVGTFAGAMADDTLKVAYDGFVVRYFINGTLRHSTPIAGLTLFMGIAMFDPGDVFSDVEFTAYATATPAQFIATGFCVVNDTSVSKVGGAVGWDSSFYSIVGYPACFVTAKPSSLSDFCMFGFSTQPATSPSYVNGNFQWFSNAPSGLWQIYELGVLAGNFSAVTLNDRASITYDGTSVRYYLNEVIKRTIAAPGLTLYAFGSLNTPDVQGGFNSVEFGPGTNVPLIDTGQVSVNAATTVASLSYSVSLGYNTGSPTTLTSITVGPFPFAATLVLTLIPYMTMNTPAGSVTHGQIGGFWEIFIISTKVGQTIQDLFLASSTTAHTSATVEGLASLAANTSALVFAQNTFNGSGFATATGTDSGVLKVEVIKR